MMSHRVESHPLPDDEEKNIISQQQRPNVQTDNQVPLFEETDKCEAGKTIFLSTVDKETQNSLKGSKGKKRAASLLDTLISTSIVAPFTIGCWRGIWGCMDRYADLFPSWSCFTLGATLHAIYNIFQHQFHNGYMHKWATSSWGKRLLYRVLRVLYTYTFGVACIAHWRGGWIIIDNYLFMHTLWITTSFTCLLLVCLAILRSVRNLIATPLIIQIDRPTFVFQFPTRYNVSVLSSYASRFCYIFADNIIEYIQGCIPDLATVVFYMRESLFQRYRVSQVDQDLNGSSLIIELLRRYRIRLIKL